MTRAEAMTVLIDTLASISTATGYQHTVQEVRTGRGALTVSAQDALPILTVHSRGEVPSTEDNRTSFAVQPWRRSIVIHGHLTATDTWDTDLDALADDLRRAVVRANLAPRPSWESIDFFPPDPNSNLCVVQAVLNFTYLNVVT